VLTPWTAPYDPAHQDLVHRLAGPGVHHWLGTDQLGRDVLSRLMYGGRFSVSIAAITLALSAVVGTVVGAFSARRGGVVDEALMRTVDLLISIPDVVVALFLISAFKTGYGTLITALTVVGWTPFARLMRGLALEINSREYIEAAEALGCSKSFIIFRHVIPNALRPVLSLGFLRFGHKLITVGGLSFLGLGVQPPDSDWGSMLLDAQPYMDRVPLLVIAPGAAIFLTSLSVTLIGHGMELKRKKSADAG
jgi:peptide/nickel transport system permease protein